MISLEKFANIIEDGLNAVLGDGNIEFRIWAHAGQKNKDIRNGNTVTAFLIGELRSVGSSNEDNILSMGENSLVLTINVPLQRPKTLASQTEEMLEKIVNSQYPFLTLITSVIDQYFSIAKVLYEQADSGDEYTISLSAGRANTGNADIMPSWGNACTVTVYISAIFLQGGVNARNIRLDIDGKRVPLTNLNISRTNRLSNDQYCGDEEITNVSTGTALTLDFAFPANADNTTRQAVKYLLQGKNNVSHFVEMIYGDENSQVYESQLYFMMFDGVSSSAEGVMFAGISGTLIQVVDNPLIINVPDYFQVGRFAFPDTSATSLTFTVTPAAGENTALAYIGGKPYKMSGEQNLALTGSDFVYDPETDLFYVWLFTASAVTISNSSATFTIEKEAVQNGR